MSEVKISKNLIYLLFGIALVYFVVLPMLGTQPEIPSPSPSPAPAPAPSPVTRGAATLKFTLRDGIAQTAITSANSYADIALLSGGSLNLLHKSEAQVTVNSNPEYSAETYPEGAIVVIHVSSDTNPTGGTDYYDGWYYAVLREGQPVRKFSVDLLTASKDSAGYYTYRFKPGVHGESTGFTVQFVEGDTNYWALGSLDVIPRTSAANLDAYLTYGGTTISSLTDGSTWDADVATDTDVTLSTTDETLWLKLDAGATNIAYGGKMNTIDNKGKIEERVAVAIFATNATGLDNEKFRQENWYAISDSTLTTEKAWYKVLPLKMPSKGNKFVYDIKIPVNTASIAATTEQSAKIWVIDFQLESNVAAGQVSTTIPTSYGMIGEFGIDAAIFARAYSTSSGASAGWIIGGVFATG